MILRRPIPLAVAAVLAATAAAAVSGCGEDDPLTADAVADAADRTISKGGSQIAISQRIRVPGEPAIAMSGKGVVDSRAKRGRMVFDLSRIPGIAQQLGGEKAEQEVLFEGFTLYMRSPLFARALPDGKRWLKLDLQKAGEGAGIDLGALSQTGQDPTQGLRYLEAASDDGVEKVGKESVRGTETTHYKATIDYERYPELVPPGEREAVRKSVRQIIRISGAKTAPVEVWIDSDGVVRRLDQTIRTLLAPGTRGSIRQRMELYGFGARVDVKTPPAEVTQDGTDLARRGLEEQQKQGFPG